MKRIPASMVTDADASKRLETPWTVASDPPSAGETATGRKFGGRLIRYLCGGGLKTFGRTVEQEERDLRQTRFLAVFAVLVVLWTLALVSG